MKKERFTPGPWEKRIAQPGTMLEIVGENREYVCSLLGGDEYKQANAALIAAAPDMLEALEWALREVEGHEKRTGVKQFMPWITNARAIIRKALGD